MPVNAKVQTKSSDGLTEARYECDSGYELFGPSTIRCDPIKGWEKELPFCGEFYLVDQLTIDESFIILYAHWNEELHRNEQSNLKSEISKVIRSKKNLFFS